MLHLVYKIEILSFIYIFNLFYNNSLYDLGENNQKKLYSGAISQPLLHSIESLKSHRITDPEDKISSSYTNFDNAATNKAPKKHPLLKQQNIDDYKSKITAEPDNYEKTNNESRVKAKILQHNFNNNRYSKIINY